MLSYVDRKNDFCYYFMLCIICFNGLLSKINVKLVLNVRMMNIVKKLDIEVVVEILLI